jgi:hypothetical protein
MFHASLCDTLVRRKEKILPFSRSEAVDSSPDSMLRRFEPELNACIVTKNYSVVDVNDFDVLKIAVLVPMVCGE